MTAYIIIRVNVTDWDTYKEYMKHSPDIVAAHGGKFVVRGSDVLTVEGEEETNRIVVLQFPSVEAAKGFYYSEAYQTAVSIRKDAADAQFIIVEGT